MTALEREGDCPQGYVTPRTPKALLPVPPASPVLLAFIAARRLAQASLQQLTLDRRAGECELPAGWRRNRS